MDLISQFDDMIEIYHDIFSSLPDTSELVFPSWHNREGAPFTRLVNYGQVVVTMFLGRRALEPTTSSIISFFVPIFPQYRYSDEHVRLISGSRELECLMLRLRASNTNDTVR